MFEECGQRDGLYCLEITPHLKIVDYGDKIVSGILHNEGVKALPGLSYIDKQVNGFFPPEER